MASNKVGLSIFLLNRAGQLLLDEIKTVDRIFIDRA